MKQYNTPSVPKHFDNHITFLSFQVYKQQLRKINIFDNHITLCLGVLDEKKMKNFNYKIKG